MMLPLCHKPLPDQVLPGSLRGCERVFLAVEVRFFDLTDRFVCENTNFNHSRLVTGFVNRDICTVSLCTSTRYDTRNVVNGICTTSGKPCVIGDLRAETDPSRCTCSVGTDVTQATFGNIVRNRFACWAAAVSKNA